MNTVERIKSICKERKIAISKLEKECGFSNGYIGQLRKGTIPDDRLRIVAEYLELSVEYLMTGEEKEIPNPQLADDFTLLIELYDSSNVDGQKRIMEYAKMISKEFKR